MKHPHPFARFLLFTAILVLVLLPGASAAKKGVEPVAIWWGLERNQGMTKDILYFMLDDGYQVAMQAACDGQYTSYGHLPWHQSAGRMWHIFPLGLDTAYWESDCALQADGEELAVSPAAGGEATTFYRRDGLDPRLEGVWKYQPGSRAYDFEYELEYNLQAGGRNTWGFDYFDARNGFYLMWMIGSADHNGLVEESGVYYFEDDGTLVMQSEKEQRRLVRKDGTQAASILNVWEGADDPALVGAWNQADSGYGMILYPQGEGYDGSVSGGIHNMNQMAWSTQNGLLARDWGGTYSNDRYVVDGDRLTLTSADGATTVFNRVDESQTGDAAAAEAAEEAMYEAMDEAIAAEEAAQAAGEAAGVIPGGEAGEAEGEALAAEPGAFDGMQGEISPMVLLEAEEYDKNFYGEVIGEVVVNKNQKSYIRSGDSTEYESITIGRSGDRFACVGLMLSGWYRILLADGQPAYISYKYTTLDTGAHQEPNVQNPLPIMGTQALSERPRSKNPDGAGTYYYYGAGNMLDGSLITTWTPGTGKSRGGSGMGEYADFFFQSPVMLDGIQLLNGYQRNQEAFLQNNRAKRIEVSFKQQGTDTFDSPLEFTLFDGQVGWQRLTFSPQENVAAFRIRILDVYSGSKFDYDVGITEVRASGYVQ